MAATSQGGGSDAPNLSAEALFGSLFEQSAMGIAVFSLGGRFLRANAAMCRMLGYSEQELLQKTHLDVMHLDDLEAAAMSRAQVISGKAKPRTRERRYLHKDGSTVWAHIAGAVDYNRLDQVPAVIRRNRASTVEALQQSGVDKYDIPAFLRKQAD